MDAAAGVYHPPSPADIVSRAASIADPTTPLKSRLDAAISLKDIVDGVRDIEVLRVYPQMIQDLMGIVRNNEPSFKKDSVEYAFRRALVEIIIRVSLTEVVRPSWNSVMDLLLYIAKTDNEDNTAICLHHAFDVMRALKNTSDEHVIEAIKFGQELLNNMAGLVEEFLAENSPVVEASASLPGTRSFKVLAEMPYILVVLMQSYRNVASAGLNELIKTASDVLLLESPAQRKEREDSEAMGNIWTGVSPAIKNPLLYSDYITGQIKLTTFMMSLMKNQPDLYRQDDRSEMLVINVIRLLQDCPVHMPSTRRELYLILRHVAATPQRVALVPAIEKLMSERILLGPSIGAQDALRMHAYTGMADVVTHLRDDLSLQQISHLVGVYSTLLHSHTVVPSNQHIGARMMFALVEFALKRDETDGVGEMVEFVIYTTVDKLVACVLMFEEVVRRGEKLKEGSHTPDVAYIERDRHIASSMYNSDALDDVMKELRFLSRSLLTGFRTCILALKKINVPPPNGEVMLPFFRSIIRCLTMSESRDPAEEKNVMDTIAFIFTETSINVTQEIWSSQLDFFYNAVTKRPSLLHILQVLVSQETTSSTLVSILLRHFSAKLDELGDYGELDAVTTIRFFKLAFSAVTVFPDANEPLLAEYLGRLIMDSFPLASKATSPTHLFHLMRALFRAIGHGGGKYEKLYREVLPLLPDMLESLNRQLQAADSTTRDLIVELCLTVPLRLTHLLPHLHYLMQPLVLALQGGPEMISQGLRTLELCIDNLIGDFLDPILRPVLRDLMEALQSHLRPLPGNHHHAHTTIRILGKLGGRNRRLLDEPPQLSYQSVAEPATVSLSLSGRPERVRVGPMALFAAKLLQKPTFVDRVHAYNYVEHTLTVLLNEGLHGQDREDIFVHCVEGLFDAIHVPDVSQRAEEYLRTLSKHIFSLELRRSLKSTKEIATRRYPSHIFALYLDAVPHGLARNDAEQAKKAQKVLEGILRDIVPISHELGLGQHELLFPLHQVSGCFATLCFQETWTRKEAGLAGINILINIPEIGDNWTCVRVLDFTRTLLHLIKDLPHEPPRDALNVIDTLTRILRISLQVTPPPEFGVQSPPLSKASYMLSIFLVELSSAHPIARKAAQTCIGLISEISGKSHYDLLRPLRERALTSLFTKPLRALPYPIVIGQIEAVRYCVSMDPPLPELSEELLRLLHETLALADMEDSQMVTKNNVRQSLIEVQQLRVACVRLLTASMPLTDFFAKQPQTRSRVTHIFFKLLYSASPEVKEVAHDGLRSVMVHQHRLPKDLLQSGLRPILMNLADPKRLSVGGLEGLARLLQLLTNYFKVEIGSKLLDHYRVIAEPALLQGSLRGPVADNDTITKLTRLVNIFHLLPHSANMFLPDLINAVVKTESMIQSTTPSPFSQPLGAFLDRYASESVDFFLANVTSKDHIRTLRNVLLSKKAPLFNREISNRGRDIVTVCFTSGSPDAALPGLLLCADLSEIVPEWTITNDYLLTGMVSFMREDVEGESDAPVDSLDRSKRHHLIIKIFMKALEESPRIDLVFELVAMFSRHLSLDLTELSHFLYTHVALGGAISYRRNILLRFLSWFADKTVAWSNKSSFVRYILSPMLLVHATRAAEESLLDKAIIHRFHETIWSHIGQKDDRTFVEADDNFRVEILYFTTIMVQHFSALLTDAKKDIFKLAWFFISNEDSMVKQTAYMLAARLHEVFESPPVFLASTWTGLLKPTPENRTLVRQSLDILSGVLQKKLSSESGIPGWVQTIRRLLSDDSQGMAQMLVIYKLITRQSDLFFPFRAEFIPSMVNSLPKLGLNATATADTRLLSLEVIAIIFKWEQKAANEEITRSSWTTPINFRENIVSYLIRLAINIPDGPMRNAVVPRALGIMKELLGFPGWNNVSFKWEFFRKTLDQTDINPQSIVHAIGSARVLHVVCLNRSDEWFSENASTLQSLIQRGLQTDEPALLESLQPVFSKLIHLYPLPKEDEDTQSEMAEFHKFTYNAISEGLRETSALRAPLFMLKAVLDTSPERIERFQGQLSKVLSRLAREHVTSAPGTQEYDTVIRLLITTIEMCQNNAHLSQEARKYVYASINMLIEKSNSPVLCQFLLDTARDWTLKRREAYPTMKDKASMLMKMTAFETRGEGLFNQFLELIYDIYTEPTLRRSDLTTRLEQAFLLGCRSRDTSLRERFIDLLDGSIPRSMTARLTFILGHQSWEALANENWIYLALDLILSAVDGGEALFTKLNESFQQTGSALAQTSLGTRVRDMVKPLRRLLFYNPQVAHETWISLFPCIWSSLSRKEQVDISHHLTVLLSREYHLRQAEVRPNVVQTLLEGIHACSPPIGLPPHLVKYLAKTFGAWHVGMEFLQNFLDVSRDEDGTVRELVQDALAELYAELAEDDMFYGLWRRRCLHIETNVAIGFEQNGMWHEAQIAYESAQSKARNGLIPFSEPEYCLWEDHWILATEKLQQWDILYELARGDGSHELLLESAWRNKDWSDKDARDAIEEQLKQMSDIGTPRRRVYEAFLALVKISNAGDRNMEFTKALEEAMQLALRKWVGLPPKMSAAHVPLLQNFQQLVELQEATNVFTSLASTNLQNLERKSSELKMILQVWRERLPNLHDDISVWSDLVAWRQNVFNAINQHYIPLMQTAQNNGGNNANSTFGYRGYHETAWIINRFAHVARKHDLLDVAQAALTRIYELPNIEISEAFLKLREEARCRLQVPDKLNDGLNLILNTNLMYFSTLQKAEFYSLKGMFYSALGQNEEADQYFGQAVQLDMNLPKAWAEWGRFNDKLFSERPTEFQQGASAVSCYLQAAGLYKNTKSRPLLTRVLWLLSIDDSTATIGQAFDNYTGDQALWYWLTLIPQLLGSLSHTEAKQARALLLNIAKTHPQALFYALRTSKEEVTLIRKEKVRLQQQMNGTVVLGQGDASMHGDVVMGNTASANGIRTDYDYVEELANILKTAYPLLALSLETMVDQFCSKFKNSSEEEVYRFTIILLHDALTIFSQRVTNIHDDGSRPDNLLASVQKIAPHFAGQARKDFEDDFLKEPITLQAHIRRLQAWRDKYEQFLEFRPKVQPLDLLSTWLVEFQYSKFDDIEVPGQYLEHLDSNSQFSRVQKFGPKFTLCRGQGFCYKRITIRGHDGSEKTFSVQQPAARWTRREDSVMQLFRTFNHALTRRKESRKRNLHFHFPQAIPLSLTVRLLTNDPSYVSMQEIYDKHCEERSIAREDPVIMGGDKVRTMLRDSQMILNKNDYVTVRKLVADEVVTKLIPETILTNYMMRAMCGPMELWRMRKAFTLQLSSVSFMTYILCITSRQPARFHISRTTGQIYMSEMLPGTSTVNYVFAANESCPFRFTPNMQHFVTPVGIEALLVPGMVALGRALTKPEYELDQHLCLFSRDEIRAWRPLKTVEPNRSFVEKVTENINAIVQKAELLGCNKERSQEPNATDKPVPPMQTVTHLVAMCTNPLKLALMNDWYNAWF